MNILYVSPILKMKSRWLPLFWTSHPCRIVAEEQKSVFPSVLSRWRNHFPETLQTSHLLLPHAPTPRLFVCFVLFCFLLFELTIYPVTLLLYRARTTRKSAQVGDEMHLLWTDSSIILLWYENYNNFTHNIFLSLPDFSPQDMTCPNHALIIFC